MGTGKELTIRELSELVVKAVGFEGEVEFDASKPDGTPRKLISVDKLHSIRLLLIKELLYCILVGQVEFFVRTTHQIMIASLLEVIPNA